MSNNDFIIRTLNLNEKDVETINTGVIDDTLITTVKLKRTKMWCEFCGAPMVSNGSYIKTINNPTIRNQKGKVRLYMNRYLCKVCGKSKTQDDPLSLKRYTSSYSLQICAVKYLSNLNYTLTDIAKELNTSKNTICNYLDSYILATNRDLPEWIGIDEIHSPRLSYKRSSYLCVLTDGQHRKIFNILGSRNKSYIYNYFDFHYTKKEKEVVKYVTIDMWDPYRDDAKKLFPNCIISVDPFHYVKHLCDGFIQLRIKIMNKQEYGSPAYYLLKKWSWLLTKEDVELDNEPQYNRVFKQKLNHRDLFNLILDSFPEIRKAFYLKEGFRDFVQNGTYEDAPAKLDEYINEFKACGIKEYDEFTNILVNWRQEIINSFYRPYNDRKLTNAYTERINGEIRKYITVSHGLGNFERFKKRVIYALNQDKYSEEVTGYALTPKLNHSIKETKIKK